ncbi:uncharacterized protein LOC123212124 isoform X1 [Mangifera indica]|uniref:uncharacterized protein LOC123212124 isoform X1 n=1 Tax=Mangifera indica TaxID=29780 RepID=UPI001CF93EE0|nr:uncharacterized protein LOC123212124 isoform X1 [Mangifera indica]
MEMARVRNWWSHSKRVLFIWFISLVLFYSLFHMALQNLSQNQKYPFSASDSRIANEERRAKLYDKMARDLDEHGAVFLKQGETSQSLSLSDIFNLKDGVVTPVLKAANPPVRANVLYMSTEYSVHISEAVKRIFSPHFDKEISISLFVTSFLACLNGSLLAIWFQNSSLYHFSMFHASHHISPVPATEDEIEAEVAAVRAVAEGLCPLKIVLDRVVLTSTGVLLGCWQVISGADPVTIRAKLRTALPHAPEKQLYDDAILHTSFARLLGHPTASSMDHQNTSDQLKFFHELVARLNSEIHGFEAKVSELWYVKSTTCWRSPWTDE